MLKTRYFWSFLGRFSSFLRNTQRTPIEIPGNGKASEFGGFLYIYINKKRQWKLQEKIGFPSGAIKVFIFTRFSNFHCIFVAVMVIVVVVVVVGTFRWTYRQQIYCVNRDWSGESGFYFIFASSSSSLSLYKFFVLRPLETRCSNICDLTPRPQPWLQMAKET